MDVAESSTEGAPDQGGLDRLQTMLVHFVFVRNRGRSYDP